MKLKGNKMYIYHDLFNSPCAEKAFNIYVRKYSENVMRYISSVSIEKRVPIQEVFEVLFSKIIENCNLVTGSNYVLTTEKSQFCNKE